MVLPFLLAATLCATFLRCNLQILPSCFGPYINTMEDYSPLLGLQPARCTAKVEYGREFRRNLSVNGRLSVTTSMREQIEICWYNGLYGFLYNFLYKKPQACIAPESAAQQRVESCNGA